MKQYVKPLAFLAMLLALVVAAALLPVREWLAAGILWIDTHRTLAWAIFILTYTVAPVLLIPGTILTLAAGFVFGLPVGVVLVSVGSLFGAASAFLVGRFFARDWVAERLATTPAFRALDRATHHEGFLIVLLTRLSPLIPFNVLNYVLGLTAVRFRDYCLASWVGMLPAIILYTYVGSVAKDIVQIISGDLQGGMASRVLFVVGLAATVTLTVFIARKATKTLTEHLKKEGMEAQDV